MKTVKIRLEKNKAIILNKDTIYLEDNEDVQFCIVNEFSKDDKLWYSLEVGQSVPILDNCFVVNSDDLKDDIKITLKSENMVFPELFILDLKMKEIKIIGDLLDEKYPYVIQFLHKEIKKLKELNVLLNKRIEHLEKRGVIE